MEIVRHREGEAEVPMTGQLYLPQAVDRQEGMTSHIWHKSLIQVEMVAGRNPAAAEGAVLWAGTAYRRKGAVHLGIGPEVAEG